MASSLPPFTVRRGEPVLVRPSAPTPRETKLLSDIDDAEGMRFYSSGIHLYRANPAKAGQDPARVVREALARALVLYYPLAGRLREEAGRKLVVDCAAQGVMLAEADADLTADDFGDVKCPPFPCFEQFILESTTVAGVEPVVDRPLLYVQVTRLKCGGFIFGQRICHCVVDAPGAMQFEKAICEFARGATEALPSVTPSWGREMFMARQQPRPSYPHLEYREPAGGAETDRMMTTPPGDMVRVPFFFGPREIAGLRQRAPPGMRCSRFELVAACIWRSRTAALEYAPDEEVRLSFIVNARGRPEIPLPEGFYGNAFAYSVAATTAGELCGGDLGFALDLVRKAKSAVTYDYLLSVADLMVLTGRPLFALSRTYIVSDVSHAGFKSVDFGWGEAVYGGPAKGGEGPLPGVTNYFSRAKNGKGEECIVVPVCLPKDAMEKFLLEVEGLTAEL
ncbi:benzyl alcohol O-benzoyltransferase-like [Miscanthus floridulus]|uniref:benzyl alcohol O-benzoyltransferase-like n=1 Tax=Miscanthus floridulus TaxID=154761 RepID=UPI0034582F13